MQCDETIWQTINHGFCSFKVKMKQPAKTFCRNPYNVTGTCNRVSCPLANSSYATVLEKEGVCWLHIKTVERAHSPKNMWEKIKLSKNFGEALQQIDKHMHLMKDHQKNRVKARLTKIRQMLIRSRRLELSNQPKLVAIKKKTERRERVREEKAEKVAKVDVAIEQELLERLKQGMYGDIYNFDQKQFDEMLDQEEEEEEEEEKETEFVVGDEDLEDLSVDEGASSAEEESSESDEDAPPKKKPRGRFGGRPHVEIEYEMEKETA